ncbi:hypothetical protein [Roseivirga pacifica]|uniref:hypothetical protein n=1 Tax=Roseivirga pacifica TaxID=1267423 RepID=UPI002095B68E|nr:hypothetical protein [Roseivirga pacifica]MCO6359325.1 hypothetical protein [Roseivirga pacifica]MCO6366695.1 hypothetical protein [Roseivirga pacifica]MCO6370773.1 hypothetical protein [Roseivirga pacifica]MCO6374351.1 hypothetical protein [Roseivirga pacifica]MCO6379610.1 hypothetical protein [Roseivirga pacifica]
MNNVKRTLFVMVLLVVAVSAKAQNSDIRTIFDSKGERSNGGYGGITTGYSKIADRDALLVGGQGAWLINHQFGIGLAGTGFMTEREFDSELNNRYLVTGGYGGLMLEFIAFPQSPIHLSFPLVVGAGGVSYSHSTRDYELGFSEDSQAFFVVEPGAEIEMNVISFMRLSFGVKYRFTSDIDLTYLNSGDRILEQDALRGLTGTVALKFGKF